nr:hypothetical protein [Clostridia bacterium]
MTAERLSALRSLRREISRTKKRIADLTRKLEKVKDDEVLLFELSCEITNLDAYLLRETREERELINFVESIEDASLREIFMLRYFDGVRTWQRVAFLAGEHDESYARRRHDTYLKKCKKN